MADRLHNSAHIGATQAGKSPTDRGGSPGYSIRTRNRLGIRPICMSELEDLGFQAMCPHARPLRLAEAILQAGEPRHQGNCADNSETKRECRTAAQGH